MKRLSSLTVLSILALGLAIPAYAEKIVVEGSTTVLPIAQRAAEEYMNANAGSDISIRGGGSGVGITSLIEGACDIGDSSRAIKDEELEKAVVRGRSPKANVIAMDGIAVIVNSANPIGELSKKQLKDIYTGKISNWSQVGGSEDKIVVVSRDSASGTYEAFGELALDKAKVRPDALMQASNQAVTSVVEKTPGAIGYVGLAYMSGVKVIKLDGVAASKETVLSKEYKLSRPLFMYTNGKPSGLVKEFIDFILSDKGQQLVEEEGYVSIK
ncbi:MAG: phosphate ABC transporter substrate-binding protein [Candidatus Omnitrophica bacterium]|nr:phosphate ABC transporter substrate-binding protein [Candidatus Omnitrophota bacterium]MDD5079767.1 phosphate ABC transporter substrate-binding protein [Candidatus Omnitrophota bacterium]